VTDPVPKTAKGTDLIATHRNTVPGEKPTEAGYRIEKMRIRSVLRYPACLRPRSPAIETWPAEEPAILVCRAALAGGRQLHPGHSHQRTGDVQADSFDPTYRLELGWPKISA